jgi:hypothetical protein
MKFGIGREHFRKPVFFIGGFDPVCQPAQRLCVFGPEVLQGKPVA